MAERPEEERLSPIVPDVNASLSGYSRHASPPPRVWPLWCLCLVLVAALAGLAYAAWQEREAMREELSRLEGQLSNVHARFDGIDQGRGERLDDLESRLETRLDERLAATAERQQGIARRLDDQGERLEALNDSAADEDHRQRLERRLEDQAQAQQSLAAMVEATRESLDALERSGGDARAVLDSRLQGSEGALEGVEDEAERLDERLAAAAERLDQWERRQSSQEVVTASLMASTRAVENRLDALATSLEDLEMKRGEDHEMLETLSSRLSESRTALTELRQSQLATRAQLEALQGTR